MKKWALVLLAILLLLGGIARFYKLDEKSLWSDEVATIATSLGNSIDPEAYRLRGEAFDPPAPVPAAIYRAKATQSHGAGNFTRIAEVLKANVHPPLFFGMMNLWIHAFGLEPGVLRIPAVLFGILSIALMYGLALRLTRLDLQRFSGVNRQGFALMAAGMMALSAYQIDHAQDARQYTLLICLALSAVWIMVSLIQNEGKSIWRWLALALILTTGLATQYFFLQFAAFIFGFLAWHFKGQKAFLLRLLGCGLLMGLLLLPWLSVFREQLVFLKLAGHYTAGLWKPLQLPEKLWRIVSEFFLPDSKVGKLVPLVMLLAWLGTVQWLGENTKRFALSPVLALLLTWLIVLVGGQIALDVLKQSHTATIRRYLLLASPACYLLMAYGFSSLFRILGASRWCWGAIALLAGLVLLMMGDTQDMLLHTHAASDEFRQAARSINQAGQAGDLVLVSKTGAMAVGMAYYLTPQARMLGVDVPSPDALNPGSVLLKRLSASLNGLSSQNGVWLVFSHTAPSTRKRLTQWLTENGYAPDVGHKVPGVRFARWKRLPKAR